MASGEDIVNMLATYLTKETLETSLKTFLLAPKTNLLNNMTHLSDHFLTGWVRFKLFVTR